MGPAWEAYWKHRALASSLGHIFRIHGREGGKTRGLEEASEELMFIAEIDQKSGALYLVNWFLQEDMRFDEEAKRSKAAYRARKASGNSDLD